MLAQTLMIQGTGSSVGKSLMVTALCRFFKNQGVRVAPFKSQNMALNSAVTFSGGEIGRAQAVQAEAAGLSPSVEMNPILLKPEMDNKSQVVVLGKVVGSMSFLEYRKRSEEWKEIVAGCLQKLRRDYELVILEGAGSPAEVNLKKGEIVNMSVAKMADSPVVLAGDIDRGGLFASFVGTLELLEPEDRARIVAFLINKFRGDRSFLNPGLEFLTNRTHVPVLGVVPYIDNLRIADEDSLSLDGRSSRKKTSNDQLEVAVIRLPRISNFDDFEPLEHEKDVVLRFIEHPEEASGVDLLILPGSKKTVSDLQWLRQNGFSEVIERRVEQGKPVLGICGGCQMLGKLIEDPQKVESEDTIVQGLGFLPLRTRFENSKVTTQVRARIANPSFLTDGQNGGEISGYEIHMGRVETIKNTDVPFEIFNRNEKPVRLLDGAIRKSGHVVGTMIHGLFENDSLRASLLRFLRRQRGIADMPATMPIFSKESEYDRLAETVQQHLDLKMLYQIIGLSSKTASFK